MGRVFFEKSQVLVDNYNTLIDAVDEVADMTRGRIRIGIPYGLGNMLFYSLVSDFSEQYPDVEIVVSGHGSRHIQEEVISGRLDIGATIIPPEIDDRLKAESIISDRYFLIVGQNHSLAQKRSVSFSALKEEKFIMLNNEFVTTTMTRNNCLSAGFLPKGNIVVNRSDFIVDLVLKGCGIAVIAGGRWRFEKMDGLQILSLDDGEIDFDIVMVTKSTGYLPAAARKFIDYAKGEGEALKKFHR